MADRLPEFIKPMLAIPGKPFSSPDHIFELKWDGIRAIAFRETDTYRLRSRNDKPLNNRYRKLSILKRLNPGVAVDGEIVALEEGKSDFGLLISGSVNEQSASLAYIVFDLLYDKFESIMAHPLVERRERLKTIVELVNHPQFIFSDGVREHGEELYDRAAEELLEGVVAKRIDSTHLPGKRSDAWVKIKRVQQLYCVVIGFIGKGRTDFKSLVVASDFNRGELRYVGNVGTGFRQIDRERIIEILSSKRREAPVVPCNQPAKWVEPELFCTVRFAEMTRGGLMRAPVFVEIASP